MIAAYLHDVGRVVDKDDLILFCKMFGKKIEQNEKIVPPILYPKVSIVLAENLLKIDDINVLCSIGCHTTLKANPSEIEIGVYLADKLSWQEDE